MRRQWSGCFVFVFYLIADGASLTVYTKCALLETKTFSCRTLTHKHTCALNHTLESKHHPEETSLFGVVHGERELKWLCIFGCRHWPQLFAIAICYLVLAPLACYATFRLWLRRISAYIGKRHLAIQCLNITALSLSLSMCCITRPSWGNRASSVFQRNNANSWANFLTFLTQASCSASCKK